MQVSEFIAATCVVALGSLVQVVSGIGGGFLIVPLLALIDTNLVPGPLVFASLSLAMIMLVRERHAVDWPMLPSITLGLIPGAACGAWILSIIPAEKLGIVFGTVILLAIAVTARGRQFPVTRITSFLASVVAGAMGASSGFGAPALALLFQNRPGPTVRATLAIIYCIASAIILVVLILFGRFGLTELRTGSLLVPGFVIAYWLGRGLALKIDGERVRLSVLLVSGLAALVLIARSL